jgi:peroxiredoxin Q/BCP
MLKQGDTAPDFTLRDQAGNEHCLADYQGHWVVLYFYPKDDTPGCKAEACAFRDGQRALQDMGVSVLGVSTDNQRSHGKFAERYRLGFTLLSDIDGQVSDTYGSLFRFWPFKFSKRHSFIIDPLGKIVRIFRKVHPKNHSDEIINELQRLTSAICPSEMESPGGSEPSEAS